MENKTLVYIEQLKSCKSKAALVRKYSKIIDKFGFSYFSLGTYLYTGKLYPQQTGIIQYPIEWESWYLSQDFNNIDPVITLGKTVNTPFVWSDIPRLITLSEAQKDFIKTAKNYGFINGMTIPITEKNGDKSILNLSRGTSDDFRNILYDVTWCSNVFHECYRKYVDLKTMILPRFAQSLRTVEFLSSREIECLAWAANGYTTKDIADRLGVKLVTVNFHLDNAKRKLDAKNLQNSIAKAISLGYIKI